jgi:hypothetical protein
MNKMKIFLSGFLIMLVVGLAPLAIADTWPAATAPAGPILLGSGGDGLSVGTLSYSPSTTTNLDPGTTILASATVTNTVGINEQLGVVLTQVTDSLTTSGVGPSFNTSNDLASQITALVWVSPYSGETAPDTVGVDYILTSTSGLVATGTTVANDVVTAKGIPLSEVTSYSTTGAGTMLLPSGATGPTTPLASAPWAAGAYTIYYQLTVNSPAPATAELQTLSIPSTLSATN